MESEGKGALERKEVGWKHLRQHVNFDAQQDAIAGAIECYAHLRPICFTWVRLIKPICN